MPTFSPDYDEVFYSNPAAGKDVCRVKECPRGQHRRRERRTRRRRRPRRHQPRHQRSAGSRSCSLPSVMTVDTSMESEINRRNAEEQTRYEAEPDPGRDEHAHPNPENPYANANTTYDNIPPEYAHIRSCAGCMLCTDSLGERLIPPLIRRRMILAETNPHLQPASFMVLNCGNPACIVEMHLRTCLHGCEYCAGNWGTLAMHDEIGYRLETGRLGGMGQPFGMGRGGRDDGQPVQVDLSDRSVFLLEMAINRGQHKPQTLSSALWDLCVSLYYVLIFMSLGVVVGLVLQQTLREEAYAPVQAWVRG